MPNIGCLVAILCLPFFCCQAQLQRTVIYDEPVASENGGYTITPGTSLSLLHRTYYGAQGLALEYVAIEKNQKPKRGIVPAGQDVTLLHTAVSDRKFFFLNRHNRTRELSLITIRPDSSSYSIRNFRSAIAIQSLFFTATDSYAVLAGYWNFKPIALFCSYDSETAIILPGFFNRNGEINDLRVNTDGSFDLLMAVHTGDAGKVIALQHYSSAGNLLQSQLFKSGNGRNLVMARMYRTADSVFIAGTYGNRAELTRGIFTAAAATSAKNSTTGGALSYTMRFYNYGDLHNFFRYLPDRKERRTKRRIQEKKAKGRKLRYPTRLLVHELWPSQDGVQLLAEAIQPVYRSGSPVFFRPVNTGVYHFIKPYYAQQRDMVFDGFRYTHALYVRIRKNGMIAWDNSIALSDIRTFSLRAFTRSITAGDSTTLVYSNTERLVSRTFRAGEEGSSERKIPFTDTDTQVMQLLRLPGDERLWLSGIRPVKLMGSTESSTRFSFFIEELIP